MPMKGRDRPSMREVDRWEGGVGWIAHPDEGIQRASHAFAVDGDVWVVDPVDAPDLDELLAEFGEVVGVVVCLNRHTRDAAAIAARHGVSVWVPEWMSGVAEDVEAPVERFGRDLDDTGYRAIRVVDTSFPQWQEVALYNDLDGTLIVPEAVGTAPYYRAPGERLGVHPMLRLFPPRRALSGLTPERVLVGHGAGIADDATAALRDALRDARKNIAGAYGRAAKNFLP